MSPWAVTMSQSLLVFDDLDGFEGNSASILLKAPQLGLSGVSLMFRWESVRVLWRRTIEMRALLITPGQGHLRSVRLITVDVDLGHLTEVGFASFVLCAVTFFSSLSIF